MNRAFPNHSVHKRERQRKREREREREEEEEEEREEVEERRKLNFIIQGHHSQVKNYQMLELRIC